MKCFDDVERKILELQKMKKAVSTSLTYQYLEGQIDALQWVMSQ